MLSGNSEHKPSEQLHQGYTKIDKSMGTPLMSTTPFVGSARVATSTPTAMSPYVAAFELCSTCSGNFIRNKCLVSLHLSIRVWQAGVGARPRFLCSLKNWASSTRQDLARMAIACKSFATLYIFELVSKPFLLPLFPVLSESVKHHKGAGISLMSNLQG